MNAKRDLSTAMAERLVANIRVGKPGFLGLWREKGSIQMCTQRRTLTVVHLQIDFTDGSSSCQITEEDFHGQLFAGWNKDCDNVDIISFMDETTETVQFSSRDRLLSGSLLVIAAVESDIEPRAEPQAWAESIVFNRGQGAIYFGSDENFVLYAGTISKLIKGSEYEVAGVAV